MKQRIKKWISNWKESQKQKKELQEIQRQSYLEEMKNQAKLMGQKQAILDSKQREELYKFKLKQQAEKIKNPDTNKYDPFGLNKTQINKEPFNIIGKSYFI